MLDTDLAELFGMPTKVFNQAVKRNICLNCCEIFDTPRKKY